MKLNPLQEAELRSVYMRIKRRGGGVMLSRFTFFNNFNRQGKWKLVSNYTWEYELYGSALFIFYPRIYFTIYALFSVSDCWRFFKIQRINPWQNKIDYHSFFHVIITVIFLLYRPHFSFEKNKNSLKLNRLFEVKLRNGRFLMLIKFIFLNDLQSKFNWILRRGTSRLSPQYLFFMISFRNQCKTLFNVSN